MGRRGLKKKKQPVKGVPQAATPRSHDKTVAPESLIKGSRNRAAVVTNTHEPDIRGRHLVWRFAHVDTGGPWPPSGIGAAAMGDLLTKMASFESMTIGEVFAPGSEHGKKYSVEKLRQSVKKRLALLERDDETEIARLRCGGKPRLYGFLREHVFYVVWWDAEHEVYPSTKRNT